MAIRPLLTPHQWLQDADAVLDGPTALIHVLQRSRVVARGAETYIIVALLGEALLDAIV